VCRREQIRRLKVLARLAEARLDIMNNLAERNAHLKRTNQVLEREAAYWSESHLRKHSLRLECYIREERGEGSDELNALKVACFYDRAQLMNSLGFDTPPLVATNEGGSGR